LGSAKKLIEILAIVYCKPQKQSIRFLHVGIQGELATRTKRWQEGDVEEIFEMKLWGRILALGSMASHSSKLFELVVFLSVEISFSNIFLLLS